MGARDREAMSEKIKSCEWMSKDKHGEIVTCNELPTKLAVRCGRYYCTAFHFKLAKHFKPFDK